MIKWTAIYARIASKIGVGSDYVRQIHQGAREANSAKAQKIKKLLDEAEAKAEKFEEEVV